MQRSRPVSIASAEHYVWGGSCDGWHLLKDPSLSVIQERVPPGVGEVRHFHGHARQFFYVLTGVATLEFEGYSVQLNPGEGSEVPPEVPHRFMNNTELEVSFLVISAPSTIGDRTNVAPAP